MRRLGRRDCAWRQTGDEHQRRRSFLLPSGDVWPAGDDRSDTPGARGMRRPPGQNNRTEVKQRENMVLLNEIKE